MYRGTGTLVHYESAVKGRTSGRAREKDTSSVYWGTGATGKAVQYEGWLITM